ncbi:SRPBCC domain-containing protein [Pseudorhodobacter sp.]|uniref:SRPBCC domain-containing protein n=1 Tax=Pseudorhodobacter sp. TaxID=1934400 RepID=UPI0026489324|nr:SRPBCC domain-containing protein [Pseudorhodobacter sp.]MDN5788895.1 SRPBCC domain-containing protein [Pseudorhodobacter sp.]
MKIIAETKIPAPINVVWRAFNDPDDILQWDTSDEWHTIKASNDLKVGGLLELRIEAIDGKSGFDFAATYTRIELNRLIEWRQMDDDRLIRVEFSENGAGTVVRQTFNADPKIPSDEERADWQGVLDNFGRHVAKKHGAQPA